jgi:hypothetical protein
MPANEHLKSFEATDADAFKSVARAWAATVTVCVVKRKPEFVSDEKRFRSTRQSCWFR